MILFCWIIILKQNDMRSHMGMIFWKNCWKNIQIKNSKLKIALYDTKYYYNYDYDKSSLKIDKGIKAKVNFFTNDKIKFYFNLVSPEEYEVTFE